MNKNAPKAQPLSAAAQAFAVLGGPATAAGQALSHMTATRAHALAQGSEVNLGVQALPGVEAPALTVSASPRLGLTLGLERLAQSLGQPE